MLSDHRPPYAAGNHWIGRRKMLKETRQCPFCVEEVDALATRCVHCDEPLTSARPRSSQTGTRPTLQRRRVHKRTRHFSSSSQPVSLFAAIVSAIVALVIGVGVGLFWARDGRDSKEPPVDIEGVGQCGPPVVPHKQKMSQTSEQMQQDRRALLAWERGLVDRETDLELRLAALDDREAKLNQAFEQVERVADARAVGIPVLDIPEAPAGTERPADTDVKSAGIADDTVGNSQANPGAGVVHCASRLALLTGGEARDQGDCKKLQGQLARFETGCAGPAHAIRRKTAKKHVDRECRRTHGLECEKALDDSERSIIKMEQESVDSPARTALCDLSRQGGGTRGKAGKACARQVANEAARDRLQKLENRWDSACAIDQGPGPATRNRCVKACLRRTEDVVNRAGRTSKADCLSSLPHLVQGGDVYTQCQTCGSSAALNRMLMEARFNLKKQCDGIGGSSMEACLDLCKAAVAAAIDTPAQTGWVDCLKPMARLNEGGDAYEKCHQCADEAGANKLLYAGRVTLAKHCDRLR